MMENDQNLSFTFQLGVEKDEKCSPDCLSFLLLLFS